MRRSDSASAVTLLSNGELHTLALGQGDPGLILANDENVALTGSEAVVNSILDVDNVEATVVALTVGDDTNTTHVTAASDHGDGASVELDEVGDLASGNVNLDGVVDLDRRVRVADAITRGRRRRYVSPKKMFVTTAREYITAVWIQCQIVGNSGVIMCYINGSREIDQSLIQRLNDV